MTLQAAKSAWSKATGEAEDPRSAGPSAPLPPQTQSVPGEEHK